MTLAVLALAFLAGVAISAYLLPAGGLPDALILALGGIAVVLGLMAFPWRRLLVAVAAAALLCAGFLRGTDVPDPQEPPPAAFELNTAVVFEGDLAAAPQPYGDARLLAIRVDSVFVEEEQRSSSFRVTVLASELSGAAMAGRSPFDFRPGDRYRVSGKVAPAASILGARPDAAAVVRAGTVSLIDEGRAGVLRRGLETTRSAVGRAIERSAPEPAAGLMRAMITGERGGMDTGLRDAFRRSGTTHVLAISGMNIGIVAVAALAFAAWALGRSRQLYLILPAIAVWGYAGLAGFLPPVTRAAIMATVYLIGKALGRQHSISPSLALAAAVMVAIDPEALGDVSFQLSFLALLGIALISPRLEEVAESWVLGPDREPPTWAESIALGVLKGVALSLAAVALTAPVIVLRFDAISIWGTPATLLQLPVLSVLIVFSMAAGFAGWLWGLLGQVLAIPAWLASEYLIGVARYFGSLPGGSLQPSFWSLLLAVAYYGVLAAVLFAGRFRGAIAGWPRLHMKSAQASYSQFRLMLSRAVSSRLLVVCVLLLGALVWVAALSLPDGRLRVTYFETSGGDSILIRTPGGRQVLIDGGDSTFGAVRSLGSRMPFWDRSLDLVVLSHPHADHARGLLAVIDRYKVDAILDSPSAHDSAVYHEWLARSKDERARRLAAIPGTVITLDHGVRLEVLAPPTGIEAEDPNDRSVVLRLAYGDRAFLFTGDISILAERWLLESNADLRADVLKVAHQGSRTSSSDSFLRAVSPAIAVVPASIGNKYGHPHAEAMERIGRVVAPGNIFVTMRRGTVDVETDGKTLTIRSAR
ncbi:MAG: DNA internalization-related competence protein ComEC/Rec2 [Chloroflexi bacterium]|nr:DNA internalization-related competence protein ComEC/Rec2 [Chloroflexota bacterium]